MEDGEWIGFMREVGIVGSSKIRIGFRKIREEGKRGSERG